MPEGYFLRLRPIYFLISQTMSTMKIWNIFKHNWIMSLWYRRPVFAEDVIKFVFNRFRKLVMEIKRPRKTHIINSLKLSQGYTGVRYLSKAFIGTLTDRVHCKNKLYDVASRSEITPCNKRDTPLVVYRFTGALWGQQRCVHNDKIMTF